MKSLVVITLGICTLAGTAYGQMPRRQPGPEHARMAYFVGQWKFDGDSEGLKYTRHETCEMFVGGFHLVCRAEGSGALGPMKDQSVMTYDRAGKSYSLHAINAFGNSLYASGSVSDSVWTWNTELVGERGAFKARLIMTEQSPTTYTFKLEGRLGDDWIVLEEGRASKVQ
jgi:hypothetical protein